MQTFHFDLSTKSVAPVLNVKQGDVGRRFKAVITDGGVAYNIPAGTRFSMWFSGPGGEGNYSAIGEQSAFAVDGNTVTVELIAQMMVNAGTGALCLVLSAADGSQLGLWNVVYAVEHVPGMGSKAAEDYYTALSELAQQAIKAAETFETDPTLSTPGKAADAAAVGAGLAGKAPAGYGLGENAAACPNSDCNQAVNSGWYTVSGSNTANGPGENGVMLVLRRNSSCIWQYHFSYSANPSVRRRMCISDAWHAWEWENPPMALGVEYRTTERWNGKAVYTKLIDCGTASDGATVSTGLPYANYHIIRCESFAGSFPLPYINGTLDNEYTIYTRTAQKSSNHQIGIQCGSGRVGLHVYAKIYYVVA